MAAVRLYVRRDDGPMACRVAETVCDFRLRFSSFIYPPGITRVQMRLFHRQHCFIKSNPYCAFYTVSTDVYLFAAYKIRLSARVIIIFEHRRGVRVKFTVK